MENPRKIFLNDEEGHVQELDALLGSKNFNVNIAFRRIHTLKGNAKLFGFDELAKFIHALEILLTHLRNGKLRFDASTKEILQRGVVSIRGALNIYGVDQNYPLVFTPKILEVLKFLKANIENETEKKQESQISDLDLKELLKKIISIQEYEYFLAVRVGDATRYIAVDEVDQIVYQPEILPLMGNFLSSLHHSSSLEKAKLVCFSGKVMPLLSCFALSKKIETADPGIRELPTVPWAVIVKDNYTKRFQGTSFCMPVDEILEVLPLDRKKNVDEQSVLSFKNLVLREN